MLLSLLVLITLTLDLSRSVFFIAYSLAFSELVTSNSLSSDVLKVPSFCCSCLEVVMVVGIGYMFP